MRRHWAYLGCVLKHKWFVFLEACKLGIPWAGLTHDLSKFRPDEWFPYARHFYGADGKLKEKKGDKTGYYRPYDTGDDTFDQAVFTHVRHNRHHWQFWACVDDDGQVRIYPMPDRYKREMLADWMGAGRAQGTPDVSKWYLKNWEKLQLHPATRVWIESQLGIVKAYGDLI